MRKSGLSELASKKSIYGALYGVACKEGKHGMEDVRVEEEFR